MGRRYRQEHLVRLAEGGCQRDQPPARHGYVPQHLGHSLSLRLALVAFWLGTFPIAGRAAEVARMAEGDGWDGLAFTDSQNLGGDTFAALAIAAQCTYQITLATGATNPVTRHPS